MHPAVTVLLLTICPVVLTKTCHCNWRSFSDYDCKNLEATASTVGAPEQCVFIGANHNFSFQFTKDCKRMSWFITTNAKKPVCSGPVNGKLVLNQCMSHLGKGYMLSGCGAARLLPQLLTLTALSTFLWLMF
eukprot:TRINITY_DN33724_c0_g1_i1.p1 TRINITY_DN33724_c0_g1~~TRINITY_DN33724_c0_g1_i1.p1  ORF type:complete len:132 (-),score=12.60 TRINITY_DN33724_c0_g1_i1:282-677(-)